MFICIYKHRSNKHSSNNIWFSFVIQNFNFEKMVLNNLKKHACMIMKIKLQKRKKKNTRDEVLIY